MNISLNLDSEKKFIKLAKETMKRWWKEYLINESGQMTIQNLIWMIKFECYN